MINKIYIIATPIGNLGDISKRAIETLSFCEVILAEDTRVARKLLDSCDIKGKQIMTFNNYTKDYEKYLSLAQNQSICIISDAGTPLICDPGAEFVKLAKEKGFAVCPIAGPCAITAALSVCGIVFNDFYFGGFFDEKKFKSQNLIAKEELLCFFLPARDILKTLLFLQKFDDFAITICIAREITKIYEDIFTNSLTEALSYYSDSSKLKGEAVVMIKSIKKAQTIELGEILQNILARNPVLNDKTLSTKTLCDLLLCYHKNELYRFSKKEIYAFLVNSTNL